MGGMGAISPGNDQFYNSKRWRKHAAAIMSRHNYIDQVQRRYGRIIQAEMIHHALPLDDFPEYAFSDFNLIPVSRATHRSLHNDDGSLSIAGIDLARRIARRAGIHYDPPEPGRRPRDQGRRYATSSH